MSNKHDLLPTVVIGAGPTGLAAAAHLVSRGVQTLVVEAGPHVGHAMRQWGHIRTFTPWRYIVDSAAEKLLAPTGWAIPAAERPPTGDGIVEYYLEPLAHALGASVVRTDTRVSAVSRVSMDKTHRGGRADRPLLVRVEDPRAGIVDIRARAVIDASGTWGQPNPLGASGLPARGELEAGRFLAGPLPDVSGADRASFAGRRALVVGAGHSAANTLLSLARLAQEVTGTEVVWAIRGAGPERVYGGGDADELKARGQLGKDLRDLVTSGQVRLVSEFSIESLIVGADHLCVVGETSSGPLQIDRISRLVAATGFRPDLSILSELQLDLDPSLEAARGIAPLIDPRFHSCGTVPPHGHRELAHPEPNFYIAGMKSYGRAPTFLIATGNEQVRSIAASIAGDVAAADDVQLELPRTGVCSVSTSGEEVTSMNCCEDCETCQDDCC